ncbi:MAG TPA: glycoside hydrolase family 28 protein [Bacteroidota bacterium]|nr:glycoside hydrolase family 28 protein [Bacteroidota bacterium]
MKTLKRIFFARSPIAVVLFFSGIVQARSQQPLDIISEAPAEIQPIHAPFEMPQLKRPSIPEQQFDIRNFGAKSGGLVKNTEPIRRTIEEAERQGGGTILIPAGAWLTGSIHLENNINLHLEKGAELRFSQDPHDYLPAVFSRDEDIECYKYSAFIYAQGKTNIAITGEGILNGQGKPWWNWKHSKNAEPALEEMASKNVPVRDRLFDGTDGRVLRPAFFQPMNCTNVLVEGVTFLYGPFWTITPTYCDNVIVRKVTIETNGTYGATPNGDGIDPSSCKNVLIEYCKFSTGDDCIAIKSGRDNDGLRVGRPTENVVVRHCVGLKGHGGIVIGSETAGGIRNIYATDCRYSGTERIVRIKTARGRGGIVENMWFDHLSADTIQDEALRINMLYTGNRLPAEPVTNTTPTIRNIHYSNISCSYAMKTAIEILGIPERPVENISFDTITIASTKGIVCHDAKDLVFNVVSVHPNAAPLLSILDCDGLLADRLESFPAIAPLIYADGQGTKNVSVTHLKGPVSGETVRLGEHISKDAVRVQ